MNKKITWVAPLPTLLLSSLALAQVPPQRRVRRPIRRNSPCAALDQSRKN